VRGGKTKKDSICFPCCFGKTARVLELLTLPASNPDALDRVVGACINHTVGKIIGDRLACALELFRCFA
jgi:hypothetical protein